MTHASDTRPVLLVNMGGPRNAAEVKPYLRRIFSDPFIIPGSAIKRWFLSRIIARAAAPESRERYATIGGGSKVVAETEQLADRLREVLAERGIPVRCAVAMRYTEPEIGAGLEALSGRNGLPVTPVYLFPHETSAMTGSCAFVLDRAAKRSAVPVTDGVRHLGITEAYTRGWARAIREAMKQPAETFVLFSCHSLPLTIVEGGDPYVGEIERSVERIAARLDGLETGLGYQSQEGDDWMGPKVADIAADAYVRGFRELIVVPLSFVNENTETLVDLDRGLADEARSMGFRRIERLPTPDSLGFLTEMVIEGLCAEWGVEH